MPNKLKYCPRCGGALVYYIDDAGRLIKWCECCRAYSILGKGVDTMDKLREGIEQDQNININNKSQTLTVKCDKIILHHKSIDIEIDPTNVDTFDKIAINGITFRKEVD